MCTHTYTLKLLCAYVSLCICVCKGHVYKKSSARCHTQPTSADSTGITQTSHVFSVCKSACHRASSSHPSSLNSYFTLICIFFTKAKSFIRGHSSSSLHIEVQPWAASSTSWECSCTSFGQSDEERETEE